MRIQYQTHYFIPFFAIELAWCYYMILDSAETVMEVIMQIIEEEEVLEFLQSPEAIAVAAPLALIAAAPPPLPTFVPQGTPPPTAGGPAGGGGGGTEYIAL